ncbi:hypothetical protein [Pseudoalteromonas luteoviolacea]|uniref:Lipoprotein n=1 Tax=Pseudoalteromonas luteoviolacea S4054 TaxID=1129367 RepID=A0A0F6AEV8_9GAMM|nr:hypothetical protein [Pseudoalteromonas luteoviolacea]AOT08378.1 hypothetical protein S4054249_11205 [Pseudoalteromonas luteoviolacea]AOT13294.1 hypothetical protein S40542_11180 [Pseudoalteromonas luteoviolacea]AOT18207.1 hypothetical protein S4054_11180 [Pseudoalteromonas luteoviolacea]KKE84326.1 hypothetical protein N479_10530 [Pseudoalteromonas luteoviolacea S4054]KZN76069.1 hypothetical protein N481_06885 [Pseudoalteromonas luteoviolacea S4047-1]
MKYLAAFLSALLLSGCNTTSNHRPADYQVKTSTPQAISSLFSSDAPVMSDEDIERALAHKVAFSKVNRIAIVNLTNKGNSSKSDLVQINSDILVHFIGKLTGSHRVYDASFMPTLLLPEQKTVPFLREAAARYQADLILVYKNSCDNFKQWNVFEKDRARASCNTEAVLIDTRTGIVPFTITSTKKYTANRSDNELSFHETIKNAEVKAINDGLGEVATKLRAFIEATPTL